MFQSIILLKFRQWRQESAARRPVIWSTGRVIISHGLRFGDELGWRHWTSDGRPAASPKVAIELSAGHLDSIGEALGWWKS